MKERGEEGGRGRGSDAGRSKLWQIHTRTWPCRTSSCPTGCFLLTRCRRFKHIATSLRINTALMGFNETSSWWFCSRLQNTCGQRELFQLRQSSLLLIIRCKCRGQGERTGKNSFADKPSVTNRWEVTQNSVNIKSLGDYLILSM